MTKVRETKLGHTLRELVPGLKANGQEAEAQRVEVAAMRLDHTALTLGASGARVKTLGAYFQARDLYRLITGHAYED
jgi:hypothetical protein